MRITIRIIIMFKKHHIINNAKYIILILIIIMIWIKIIFRPSWSITTSSPGSDLAGETSAALAAASIYFVRSSW